MFEGYSDDFVTLSNGITLRVRSAGNGPAVLLLHGYPQTHVIWHKMAPLLVGAGFRVVLPDLRGYGDSSKPASESDHSTYSKREMAKDQVLLMDHLGFDRFAVVGHDRGARVAHRLARDWSDRVSALCVMDIAPTEYMYANTNMSFATGYFHWFFLIQPAPLPEQMINADPEFWLRTEIDAWSQGNTAAFTDEAMEEYVRCFAKQGGVHATCEDYRASATIDLEHDKADQGRKLTMPVQALWGANGLVGRSYDVTGVWSDYAEHVEGQPVPGGHFLPEEAPNETAEALISFLNRNADA